MFKHLPFPSDHTQFDVQPASSLPPLNTQVMSVAERVKQEHTELSANRGQKYLARLYDVNDPSGYVLPTPVEKPEPPPEEPISDLPLRKFSVDAPTRESMIEIDLDEAGVGETATSTFAMHMHTMNTINEDTIRPSGRHAQDDSEEDNYQYGPHDERRATMEWSFPAAAPPPNRATMEWSFPQQHQTAPRPLNPNRGTMDWTFDAAEPAAPEEPDHDLSHSGELPPNFRPHIKHAATEPIGRFGDHQSEVGMSSPNRGSIVSLIDLDEADRSHHGSEIPRPSTASSHLTDATSGNPFDLEEDQDQQETDRNRFSYHKQWRSDGVEVKRNSHRNMPMHARGSSLSSTESEVQEIHSGLESGFDDSIRHSGMGFSAIEQGLGLQDDSDSNQWPPFSTFDSFDASPQYLPKSHDVNIPRFGQEGGYPLEHGIRTTTFPNRMRDPSVRLSRPEIDFPALQPPHPDAMMEGADDSVLMEELNRTLTDLSMSLTGVVKALGQHANLHDEHDDISSDIESGTESNRETTEDEEPEHLTARRKPRKLEVRTPAAAGEPHQ